MIQKLKNIDYKILLLITVITTILCSAFLQMHYSSDTYVLLDLGYMNYPSKYFLLDGRLISTIFCYIAGFLHLPYTLYIIGMDALGILFISVAIYILYKCMLNITKTKEKNIKLLFLGACFVLILNQFSLEYLVFPESAVMCLGELLCVVAATKVISSEKFKYLKIILLIFLATFCYQGLLNIFPVLAIVLIFLNQMYKENSSFKQNLKEFIKKFSAIIIICIIMILLNILSIKIGCKLLNDSSNRTIKITDFESFTIRVKTITSYMDQIWNDSLNMLPKHINSIIVLSTLILLILSKSKKEIIFKYLFSIFSILLVCIIPMFFLNSGPCGRVNIPISEIWGISLLFLITNMTITKKINKYIKYSIYLLIITSFVINSIMILRNSEEHIAANKVDQNMGLTIKYILDEYENKTGINVTKFSYVYDPNPQQYAPGIRKIGSLTERKIACSWCITQAMDYYCNRKFEKIRMPIKIYTERFPRNDYTCFSEEQVIFDNDTLYLYIY